MLLLTVTSGHAQKCGAGHLARAFRPVVRSPPCSEQRPCRRHEVCVVGYRLGPGTDAYIDRISERDRHCDRIPGGCRRIAEVAEVHERWCDSCDRGERRIGVALDRRRSERTRQISAAATHCRDTTWDLSSSDENPSLGCVDESLDG